MRGFCIIIRIGNWKLRLMYPTAFMAENNGLFRYKKFKSIHETHVWSDWVSVFKLK